MAKLSTTTWPRRHENTFKQLAECIERFGIERPTILEVGPGATSNVFRNILAGGEGENLSFFANRFRAFLRNIDSLIRHIPFVGLHSFEPGELLGAVPKDSRVIVTDINPKVIKAISKQYPQVDAQVKDFSVSPLEEPVDIIVCLCVLVRAQNPAIIFRNLYNSLKKGGIFVIDNRSKTKFSDDRTEGMERLYPQIWRKI